MGRFSHATIGTNRPGGPISVLLTGRPNVGKTFFASTIPHLFFIPVEAGLKGTSPDHEVNRAVDQDGNDIVPANFDELIEAIDYFKSVAKQSGFRHLCIDSMTGVEKLINRKACKQERVSHMDAKEFKEVWGAAQPFWDRFKDKLESVLEMGINYWVIAHSAEADETDSNGVLFKKWDLHFDGNGKVLVNMRNEWRRSVDTVLFMDWDSSVRPGKVMTSKAVGVYKSRVLYTRESPRHFAKNRSNLPGMLPATWADFSAALRAGIPASDAKLRQQIAAVAGGLSEEHRAAIEADVRSAKSAVALASVLSRAQGFASVERSEADDMPEVAANDHEQRAPDVDAPSQPDDVSAPADEDMPTEALEPEERRAAAAPSYADELRNAATVDDVNQVYKRHRTGDRDADQRLIGACAARKAKLVEAA